MIKITAIFFNSFVKEEKCGVSSKYCLICEIYLLRLGLKSAYDAAEIKIDK